MIMKPSKSASILAFSLLGLGVVQAQSGGEPGSQVEAVLFGSGAQSATFTYSNGRVDLVTNQISVTLRLHPYSPQPESNLYLSTLADFNGIVSIHSTATAIEGGSSDTQDFRNDATFTNYVAFSTQTEFFKADGTVASLTLSLLDPNTISPRQLEPYRLFYDGTNGVLTVWIRLPSPFIYSPYPSNDEAWQIPCSATVTGQGSTLKGFIEDALSGQPLPGATAVVGSRVFTSDIDGSFLVPLTTPGPLSIQITDPGYGLYQATKILPPFSAVEQTFELSRALAINGRVLDAKSGQVLGGVKVSLAGQNTTTLGDGTFRFADVSLADGSLLVGSLPGYATASLAVTPPAGASVFTVPDLLLQPNSATNQPVVTSFNATFEPVFISGLPITDVFTASIDWNGGEPGTVEFDANGQPVKILASTGPTYTVALDSTPFNPSLIVGENMLSVVAKNSQGIASAPASMLVYDVPYPSMLALVFPAGSFHLGSLAISADATWPDPPFNTTPLDLRPFGTFGLDFQVNPHFEYDVGDREWGLEVRAQVLKLELGAAKIDGKVTLTGTGYVSPVGGFTDSELAVGFLLGGGPFKIGEFGMLDLLGPGISGLLSREPVVDDLVKEISIEVYVEPEIGGDLKLDFPDFQFKDATLEGSIAVDAEYEPDLGGVAKLKAYVGGKPSLTLQIPSEPPGGFLRSAEFEAYAGLEVDVWIFRFNGKYVFLRLSYPSGAQGLEMLPRAAGYWMAVRNPDPGLPRIVARPNLVGGREAFVANENPSDIKETRLGVESGLQGFRAMGKRLAKRTPFGKSGSGVQPLGLGPGGGSLAQADLTLVTNTFPNNDPSLASLGQELMLLYVADNGSSNNLDFTDIKWTRFDGTNWSTPLTIQTNTQAEFEPQVKYDGNGNAIAVWDRVNDPNFDQTNLTAMSADMEIVWSEWNRASGAWSTPVALTANNYLDHAPLLCGSLSDGSLLLTWTANTSNLLIDTNGAGSQVLWSRWDPVSQTWSTPQILVTNLTYRLSQSLSGAGKLAVYTWSQDMVGTLTNTADDQVFYCTWSNGMWSAPAAFTANASGNRNARVAVSPSGDVYWMWQQGSNLVISTNFSSTQTLVRADSQTAGFSDFAMTLGPANHLLLLWQDMTTNGCHAHYSVYDPVSATWSQNELLRDDPPLERSFAPVWDNAGNLTVAYDVVNISNTNLTVTLTNGEVLTITNVPQPGDVDIVATKRALVKDLALLPGDFTVSGTSYLPGDLVTLAVNVRNLGDLAMSNVAVSFYDGDPNAGGVLITNVALTGWLPAGATNGAATVQWVLPPSATNYVLYAVVDEANASAEFNPANNTQSLRVGGTDLAVSLVSYDALTNGSVRVIAQVQNLGTPTATNSTLAIRRLGQTGAPLASAPVPALAPGQLAQVPLDMPAGTQPVGEAQYRLFADDDHVVPDVNTNNNVRTISVVLWVDSDGDGIPDSWMLEYFGHPTGLASDNSLAGDDADGTGMSNLGKFLAGLNPTNPASVFQINSLNPAGTNLVIDWQSGGGRSYVIQAAGSVTGPYTNSSSSIYLPGSGDVRTNSVVAEPIQSPLFYRIKLGP